MEETSGDDQDIEKIAERYRSTLDKDDSIEVLAEAHYRLGLYELIQQRNIEQATHHFQESAGLERPLLVACSPDIACDLPLSTREGAERRLFEFRRVGFSEVVNEHSVNALLMMGRLLRDDGDKEEASGFSEGLKRIKARLKEPGEDRKEWLILGLAFASECEAQAELELGCPA